MYVDSILNTSSTAMQAASQSAPARPVESSAGDDSEVREAFQSFVGETLFGQMLKAMRKTVGEPAYFHGGRAEEVFQSQLDQVLAEKMANAGGASYSDAMFELFSLKRS